MRLAFDIETDGLLDAATRVHCIGVIDIDTGKEWMFVNELYKVPEADGDISDCLELLDQAELLTAHNGQGFDFPALKKLHGWEPKAGVSLMDTLVAARVVWSDTKTDDFKRTAMQDKLPTKLIGRHSLEAWGYRLGVLKGDYGDNRTDWSVFDMDMMRYCIQDVRVLVALYKAIEAAEPSQEMLDIEHKFSAIMDRQHQTGFCFDVVAAEELSAELMVKREELKLKLADLFPPREVEYLTPKRKERRTKTIPFNPGSRDQIAWHLKNKYGWRSPETTKMGKPKIDETILKECKHPEAEALVEYFTVQKRLGQIAEGNQAWLGLVREDGRIHGKSNPNGTVTGRPSFHSPNLGQVPAIQSPYGAECRALFTARPGWKLVGADAAGIQLRMLAHFLARFDDGKYVDIVLNSDPHVANQEAAGLKTRSLAKKFIYAFLFGAGSGKIGKIVEGGPRQGKKLIERFYSKMPAVKQLKDALATAAKRGYLIGLDGRHFPIRSDYVALNVLLMGAEAVMMKKAVILFHELAAEAGLEQGKDYEQVAFVYDEVQAEARPEVAEQVGQLIVQAIRKSGEHFNLRIPMDGEYSVGLNWKDTH